MTKLRLFLLSVAWSALLIGSITSGQQLVAIVIALMVPALTGALLFGTESKLDSAREPAVTTWVTLMAIVFLAVVIGIIVLESAGLMSFMRE